MKRSRTPDQALPLSPACPDLKKSLVTVSTQTRESSNAICGIDDDFTASAIEQKSLSAGELVQQVLEMIKNRDRAELMILELMGEYSFSYYHLKELMRGSKRADPNIWRVNRTRTAKFKRQQIQRQNLQFINATLKFLCPANVNAITISRT